MTLLDRYLLFRFVQAFCITFAALFGLYVVLDVFSNIDEFAQQTGGFVGLLKEMGYYYGIRAAPFFNTVGSLVAILSAMLTLAWTWRCAELNPVLSAGIPTYRFLVPILFGNIGFSLLLAANQEYLLPRLAHQLQIRAGQQGEAFDKLKPTWDFVTNVYMASGRIYPQSRKIADAEFVLPVPELVTSITTLKAATAVYVERSGEGPAGWLLHDVTPRFRELRLTEVGAEFILATEHETELFLVSDVNFDEIQNRGKFYEHLSTPELLERAANPAAGILAQRAQSLHVHSRLTRPLFNLVMLLMVIPILLRKETPGLVVNLALSLLGSIFALGLQQGFMFMGHAGALRLDLAAWAPIMICGLMAMWLSARIRT